jgi:hypothetical protein
MSSPCFRYTSASRISPSRLGFPLLASLALSGFLSPSRPVSQPALLASLAPAILLPTTGPWQHVGAVGAAAMAQTANVGNVAFAIGTNAMLMTWIPVLVEFSVIVILLAVITSIIVFEKTDR